MAPIAPSVEEFVKRRIPEEYRSKASTQLIKIFEEHPETKEAIKWRGPTVIVDIKGFSYTDKPKVRISIKNYIIYTEQPSN